MLHVIHNIQERKFSDLESVDLDSRVDHPDVVSVALRFKLSKIRSRRRKLVFPSPNSLFL